jgi:signal-transduction protein with cAMP-binding, CBS, and nucleotidyltransferase domain
MKQSVGDWMITPVVDVLPEVSVDQAIRLMRDCGIQNLVVDISLGSGKEDGIVAKTDVFNKIVDQNLNPSEYRAAEIMTAPIECAEVNWTLRQASELMQAMGVHHLPVKDERAAMVGVISATDIFLADEDTDWSLVS